MIPDADHQADGAVSPLIDIQRCSGCGPCVSACPERLFTLETTNHHKTAKIITPVGCTLCGACISACPLSAVIPVSRP